MKNFHVMLSRLLLLTGLFLFVSSCSKDTQLPANSTKAVVLPKEPPINNYGSLKGFTTPVSLDAKFVLDNHQGITYSGKINENGGFAMEGILEGVYQMDITYLTGRADFAYYALYTIDRVVITGGTVTNLGEIKLPWVY